MALIKVERFMHNPESVISRVYVRDKFFCYSIEDAERTTKIKGATCIPLGTYDLGLRFSPNFSKKYAPAGTNPEDYKMIWVQNVPGYEYILIHTGNTISDTEGCLILGKTIGRIKDKFGVDREAVLNSKAVYFEFYASVINDIKAGGQKIEYVSI